ncbi:hypothetical protein [Thermophagus xiamenensis]|nr:hypothetical protein [Thermophagus xiamenensis]
MMKYEIKIDKGPEAKGTIDLQRLGALAESFRKIAEGALQIRLRGVSFTKGKKKLSLYDALKVSISGIKGGSTILCLDTEQFGKTLEPYQTDIFRQEAQQALPGETPVSLFISTFKLALDGGKDQELLDKQLLKQLKQFKSVFLNDDEILTISNQGSIPELILKKEDFNKIKVLEEEIPDSEPIILNGIVDELKYSKLKVKIQTAEGIVDGFLSENLSSEKIAQYWGKEVTITGTAHFKPGGKSVIEINNIFEPGKGDSYFSRKPKTETVEQQLQRQIREKGGNRFSEIVGKWPGDEDFEDLLKMLTK